MLDINGAQNFPHVYRLIGKNGFCVPILGLVDEAEKLIWHGAISGKPKAVFGTTLWASNPGPSRPSTARHLPPPVPPGR